jgi:predicted PurR-regulated permease PerM
MLLMLAIALLLAGSFWTLLPFLGGAVWAVTIVVATWPILLWVQRHVGGRRATAAALMTLLVLAAFILPFLVALTALLNAAEHTPAIMRDFLARGLGPPPQWLASVPIVGEPLANRWQTLSAAGPEVLAESIRPHLRSAANWAMAVTGGVGMMMVHALLAVVLVAILYLHGETAARGALAVAYRMGRERGEEALRLAGRAARSVALGVVVTAVVQSILAGLGLWLSGIPYPGVLTAIALILGIAQLGPLPILMPAVIWLYWTGAAGWATALAVWSLPVIALDNVLRPLLIRRGIALPMLLIIAGVIGGLIGFGVIGLFVGPVALAVTYTLAQAWVAEVQPRPGS